MLLGTYQGVISPKRRVAIPSSFRKEQKGKFILAKWYEGCLVLIQINDFQALLEKLRNDTELITRGVRDTERFILGSAYEVVPDEQGRIVIPSSLVTYAGLKEEIYFIGLKDRVEIWEKGAWEIKEKAVAAQAAELLEKMANEK